MAVTSAVPESLARHPLALGHGISTASASMGLELWWFVSSSVLGCSSSAKVGGLATLLSWNTRA